MRPLVGETRRVCVKSAEIIKTMDLSMIVTLIKSKLTDTVSLIVGDYTGEAKRSFWTNNKSSFSGP